MYLPKSQEPQMAPPRKSHEGPNTACRVIKQAPRPAHKMNSNRHSKTLSQASASIVLQVDSDSESESQSAGIRPIRKNKPPEASVAMKSVSVSLVATHVWDCKLQSTKYTVVQ